MRVIGEQFVCGQTIEAALANARPLEARGFRYSYDMLGEAAPTAEDAERYLAVLRERARRDRRGLGRARHLRRAGPSVKLSALHPRYVAQPARARVRRALSAPLRLAVWRARWDIGLNIDAEESERLDLSLDLLEALCRDPAHGRAGTASASSSRPTRSAPIAVIDWIIDLARATKRRIMLRLVKGAYWDSEIKRAQVEGLEGFAVFTRKIHTDVSYIACAQAAARRARRGLPAIRHP